MRSQTSVEAVQSKKVFGAFAKAHEIEVKHYRADNGIFAAKIWKKDCIEEGLGLTFACVKAHHQNGCAERKIRSIQDLARPMMIHAHHQSNSAITSTLWPYAVRYAADSLNNTACKRLKWKATPLQVFSRSAVDINPIHWFSLFCPVYVLNRPLQTG